MKNKSFVHLLAVISALHVAAFGFFFGSRHCAYILAATFSATLIWAVVFSLSKWKRRRGTMLGLVLGLIIQQVAYQFWKAELPGFWWPLAQFVALQILVAYLIRTIAP